MSKLADKDATASEINLRTHWEELATAVSRDPRFIRQLFLLLQEIEVASEQSTAYNLAPIRQPVQLDLPAPTSTHTIQSMLALIAGSASRTTLNGVLLNGPVLEAIKLHNQVGASLRWEQDGRIDCTGDTPTTGMTTTILDKVVHVGSDSFSAYILLFQMVTRATRIKIVGESALRFINLRAVRHFMPALGARLTCLVPGQEGLPLRLESSGLLPEQVAVPNDLPFDALVALLLAAPFWDRVVSLDLNEHPNAEAVLARVLPLYDLCSVGYSCNQLVMEITPAKLHPVQVPDSPALPMDLALCAPFLALAVFAGGSVTLNGWWNEQDPLAEPLKHLLQGALTLDIATDKIIATAQGSLSCQTDLTDMPEPLIPLALALLALQHVKNGATKAPVLPKSIDTSLAESFLQQMGCSMASEEMTSVAPVTAPWASPSAHWAMALALGAFVRPHIKLTNPSAVTALLPDFWKFYNDLPAGKLTLVKPREAVATKAPARRRRVLAGYMPDSERPEPVSFDQD